MKLTLLFSTLFFVSTIFAQGPLNEPFSNQDIQIICNQYASKTKINKARGLFQKLDSSTVLNYNEWSQSWDNGPRTQYEYFSDGILKSQISETFESLIDIRAFNNNGQILYHKYQSWNGSSFEDFFNTVYIYDNDGLPQSDTNYEWTGSHWEVLGYSEYQLNTQGHMQQKLSYHYQGGVASPTQKFSFVNNPDGKISNLTTYQYLNGHWENYYNYFYIYNSLGRTAKFYYQTWDAGNWVNSYKSVFTFISNNQTLSEAYYWDNTAWVLESRQEFQYEIGVSTNSVWLPVDLNQNHHKITGIQSYFYFNGFWGYLDSTNYFYSDATPNSVPLMNKESQYALQANPVVSEINIVNKSALLSQISVYSYTGKLLITQSSGHSLIQLDASTLPTGMYFVHIENANDRAVLKVMVSK